MLTWKWLDMKDKYMHSLYNIIYVPENIPGPISLDDLQSLNILENFDSQLTQHCNCNQKCNGQCNCIILSGGRNYVEYVCTNNSNAQSFLYTKATTDKLTCPVFECNNLCSCPNNCTNRLVQIGPIERLKIKNCDDKLKGFGLFTVQFIPKGTFVCEYAGEVISKLEALKRHKMNSISNIMNYIICVNEYSNGQVKKTIVDPSTFGNIGRYINHSCEPNCEIIPVRIETPIPHLAIFSKIDIAPNSEITFNYGSGGDMQEEETSFHNLSRKECFCGSYLCRKWLPFENY